MKKILVIDDDDRLTATIAFALRLAGHAAILAPNGSLGLELARAQRPDLVLSDVNMEGLDGFELLQALRVHPDTAAIPVILMTGGDSDLREGMDSGADDYLRKPFTTEALLTAVRVRLERRQSVETHAKVEEARLLEILSATHDLVAIADARTEQLHYLNRVGRAMLGIGQQDDITTLRLTDFHATPGPEGSTEATATSARRLGVWVGETVFVDRQGRQVPVSMEFLVHRTPSGEIAYLSIVARDLSERLAAEKLLRESENLYRSLIQAQGEGFVIVNTEFQYTFANPAAEEILGVAAGKLVGRNLKEFLTEQGAVSIAEQMKLRRAGQRSSYELAIQLDTGEHRHLLVTGTPKLGWDGQFQGTFAVFRDITERKEAEEQLHVLNSALEAAANGIVITDCRGRILWVNRAVTSLTGYSAAEAIGNTPAVLKSGSHPRAFYEKMWQTILSGDVWQGELVNRRKDGSSYEEEMAINPILNEVGEITHFVAIKRDISQRKEFERTLAHERDLLQSLMDNLPDHIYFKDLDSRFTRINQAHARSLGLGGPQEAVGKSDADFFPPRFWRQTLVDERRILATGEPILGTLEEIRTAGGKTIWVSATKVALRDQRGKIAGLVGVSRDVTKQHRIEEQLAHERDLLRTLMENSPDFIYFKDRDSRFLRCSRTLAERCGVSRVEDMVGRQDSDFFSPTHAGPAFADEQEIMRTGRPLVGKVEQEVWKDTGLITWALTNKMPLRNNEGKIIGTFGISKDITALKEAERQRQLMELQLRQAQKLESIGQVAAGIAHEINTPTQYVGDNTRFLKDAFNDLTKVLHSHTEMVAAARQNRLTPATLEAAEKLIASVDLDYLFEQIPAAIRETLEGVDRVTKIVRAMKEFSHPGGREKAAADLNKAIETTVTVARNEWKYLADLELDLDPALPPVPCFLGEFNQCILNLVVNAAHAIAEVVKHNPGSKGTIKIRTRRDGDDVEVRVSDTGTGIPEAVRPHIFEPFFTTKEVGKGTGQGLSIIYANIVQKHGGTVTFETETGQGTTFILRLPIVARASASEPPKAAETIPAEALA